MMLEFVLGAKIWLGLLAWGSAPPVLPIWQRDLPRIENFSGGHRWLRTMVHVHSVHSHDACKPQLPGFEGPCLDDLRAGICRNHVDVVFLTEHRTSMASTPFDQILHPRPQDQVIERNGKIAGIQFTCPNGHEARIFPGAENKLMPIGLLDHPRLEGVDVNSVYGSSAPNAIDAFKKAGALVAVNHTERHNAHSLLTSQVDLIEVYNTHANLYQKILSGIPGIKFAIQFLEFMTRSNLEPDLIFLALFAENRTALKVWAQMALERRTPGIAGADIHQNTFPKRMKDGERGDSYRRAFRWFSNWVKVDGEITREKILESLKEGRSAIVFEIFGQPENFGFSADDGEMGASGKFKPLHQMRIDIPQVTGLPASLPQPKVSARILKASRQGWREVARSQPGASTLIVQIQEPGAYRAEVRILPLHLRPYLPGLTSLIREQPWIYSNPIYLLK